MTKQLLDIHAPAKTVSVSSKFHKPFYTTEIKTEKAKRSKLETIYRHTRSDTDFQNFRQQARVVSKLITSARKTHFRNLVDQNCSNPRKLWASFNSLMSRTSSRLLPSSTSSFQLANSFSKFFTDKIAALRSSLPSVSMLPHLPSSTKPPELSTFAPSSPAEVRNAILRTSNACCDSDFLPLVIVKH